MVGSTYTATGITLRYGGKHGWTAKVEFQDAGFCDGLSTGGELHTRYYQNIETAIDTIRVDAEAFGIQLRQWDDGPPWLYVDGDGEDWEWPVPDGWKETLREQAVRIGWNTYGD